MGTGCCCDDPSCGRHYCEPSYYPSGPDQEWTCPECGRVHRSFLVNADPKTHPRVLAFLTGETWGWRSRAGDFAPHVPEEDRP